MKFQVGDTVVHRKGGRYVIHIGPDRLKIEATNEPAYCYAPEGAGVNDTHWIRPQTEMEDGRFTSLKNERGREDNL